MCGKCKSSGNRVGLSVFSDLSSMFIYCLVNKKIIELAKTGINWLLWKSSDVERALWMVWSGLHIYTFFLWLPHWP